jgi:hypothetical protein
MATKCEHSARGQCVRCQLQDAFALEDDVLYKHRPKQHIINKNTAETGSPPNSPTKSIAVKIIHNEQQEIRIVAQKNEIKENIIEDSAHGQIPQSFTNKSGLLRLFKSEMLTPHLAMQYLFKAKEPGVLAFLGTYLIR